MLFNGEMEFVGGFLGHDNLATASVAISYYTRIVVYVMAGPRVRAGVKKVPKHDNGLFKDDTRMHLSEDKIHYNIIPIIESLRSESFPMLINRKRKL